MDMAELKKLVIMGLNCAMLAGSDPKGVFHGFASACDAATDGGAVS